MRRSTSVTSSAPLKPIMCAINNDSTVNVVISKNDGTKVNKLLSLNSFVNSLKVNDDSFELELMPNGFRKLKKVGNNYIVVIEQEPCIVDFKYGRGVSAVQIPVPRSLWFVSLSINSAKDKSYRIIGTHIYSIKMPLFSETQELFDWPFPNHSITYSSGICWGNDSNFSRLYSDTNFRNLSSLFSMYFSAVFNSDLGWKYKIPRNSTYDPVIGTSYVDFLIGKPEFDSAWLTDDYERKRNFTEALNNVLPNNNRR